MRHPDELRVALVIPQQGPAGIFALSCEAAAELAADRVNAEGGICGRELRLEILDGGAHPRAVAATVKRALDERGVEAVTGWHISAVRQQLAPLMPGRAAYVYTSLYEGGESRPEIICTGEVPRQQIMPALRWLRDNSGIRSWCIVGDDYVWPRASAAASVQFCRDLGLTVTDQIFVPYGSTDFRKPIRRVARSAAQGVLMLLVGQDAVLFNREFAARSLHDKMVRFTPLMEENMLLASGPGATRNLYVAAAYFNSLATGDAMELMSAYIARFGADGPPLNDMAESCYEGILALRELHHGAKSCALGDLVAARQRVGFDGPRGPVCMVGSVLDQRIYLATADDLEFDVIATLTHA